MNKNLGTDRLTRLVIVFCLIAIQAAGLLTFNVFQKNKSNQLQTLHNEGSNLVTDFDHELKVHEVTLEILSAEAHSILDGRKYIIRGTTADLAPTGEPPGYTLNLPRDWTEQQVGNLTGLGKIPSPITPLATEIGMALGLSPLFEQVIRNHSTLPWVYYTSINRFIYMYPRVPPEAFFYSDELLEAEFFTIATAENNPGRDMVWSDLYEDSAGAGLMVTLSKPIYHEDTFLGVLSIDVGVSSLRWLLESRETGNASAYLVGSDGNSIVGVGETDLSIDIDAIPPETLTTIGGRTVMVFPLNEVDWYIVMEIDNQSLFLSVLNDSATAGLVFLFVVFTVVLVVVITFYMRTARYMAVHDDLTGLLNRRAFDELAVPDIHKHSLPGSLVGMAVVDIDFFKKYNDYYGHVAGDGTLRRVANALINSLRSPTDKVYRVGGEEFAVVLIIKDPEDLRQILCRLVDEVNDLGIPHKLSPFEHVTVSAGGVTAYIDSIKTLEDAYKRADKILYQAKDAGRNRWVMA